MTRMRGHLPCSVVLLLLPGIGAIPTKAEEPARKASTAVTGILGALPEEVNALEMQLTDKKERTIRGFRFVTGRLKDRNVVLVQSGMGKVNATMAAALLLEHFQPDRVLFTGSSGGINAELGLGDIVIGSKTGQHDFGTLTAQGFRMDQTTDPATGKKNPHYFPADKELLTLAERVGAELKLESIDTTKGKRTPRVKTGVIVTGDVFVASHAKKEELRKNHQADVTEMEGAAVAQVCWQQGVPCLIIRSVSDTADHQADEDFRQFLKTASRNSALLVTGIVAGLESK